MLSLLGFHIQPIDNQTGFYVQPSSLLQGMKQTSSLFTNEYFNWGRWTDKTELHNSTEHFVNL